MLSAQDICLTYIQPLTLKTTVARLLACKDRHVHTAFLPREACHCCRHMEKPVSALIFDLLGAKDERCHLPD